MHNKRSPEQEERMCDFCARPRVDRYEGACWDACGKANPLCGEGDWDMFIPKKKTKNKIK